MKNVSLIWKKEQPQQLVDTLSSISSSNDIRNFLRDVLTEKEILEISARLEAARMLECGNKYTDIVSQTKLSSRTVARVSVWLKNGCGGYRVALDAVNQHQTHTLPARAE